MHHRSANCWGIRSEKKNRGVVFQIIFTTNESQDGGFHKKKDSHYGPPNCFREEDENFSKRT